MVFAHPGHELTVAGMLLRYQPHLLFLTRADAGQDQGREQLARYGLDQMGLAGKATFLRIAEAEVFRALINGDWAFFQTLRNHILEWLVNVRPALVFGDAFEFYNVNHDLCRVLLDSAVQEYRASTGDTPANHEILLACYANSALAAQPMHMFDFLAPKLAYCELTQAEVARKQELIRVLGSRNSYIGAIAHAVPQERFRQEPYRPLPRPRDYTQRFSVPWPTYEEHGRQRTQSGKYEQAILFSQHFVPLAQAICSFPSHCSRVYANTSAMSPNLRRKSLSQVTSG
jgi:hypothetical protein